MPSASPFGPRLLHIIANHTGMLDGMAAGSPFFYGGRQGLACGNGPEESGGQAVHSMSSKRMLPG